MLASALRRRVEAAGGFVTVLARGDETAGAMLLICHHRGAGAGAFERLLAPDGRYRLTRIGPPPGESLTDIEAYASNRRRNDPDLWLIEVDVADSERFAAETIAAD